MLDSTFDYHPQFFDKDNNIFDYYHCQNENDVLQ